jgi:hypothetical protein
MMIGIGHFIRKTSRILEIQNTSSSSDAVDHRCRQSCSDWSENQIVAKTNRASMCVSLF